MAIQQDWGKTNLADYLQHESWKTPIALNILAWDLMLDPPFPDEYERLLVEKASKFNLLKTAWYEKPLTFKRLSAGAYSPDSFIEWAISKNLPPAWLDWAIEHNLYPLATEGGVEPVTTPICEVETDAADYAETLAALFDPVPVEALEKMFPSNGNWKKSAERAARNGLDIAREGRGRFNPYKAGVWFVGKGAHGWDTARLHRTLANNLPARSLDNAYLLTGEAG